MPFDVSEQTLRRGAASRSPPSTRASRCTPSSATSSATSPLLPRGGRRLVAFLGGTIGNLNPVQRALPDRARSGLAPGDSLLLGTDLVKDPARLVAAYDDAAGVTAEFNRNVLHVLNRELGADFDPTRFAPRGAVERDATSGSRCGCARSTTRRSRSRPSGLEVDFAAGEEMRTEISAKFRLAKVARGARRGGLRARLVVDRRRRRLRAVARLRQVTVLP